MTAVLTDPRGGVSGTKMMGWQGTQAMERQGTQAMERQGTQAMDRQGTQAMVQKEGTQVMERQGTQAMVQKEGTQVMERQGTQAMGKQGTLAMKQLARAALSKQATGAAEPQGTQMMEPGSPTDIGKGSTDGGSKTEELFKEEYRLGEKLGEGAYATVHKCVRLTTDDEYAVKVIDKNRTGLAELHGVKHEVNIMQDLCHPFICAMHAHYEGPCYIYIVLDYIEGSTLFDRIIAAEHFTEEIASRIMKNLLQAIQYLHDRGIMHRDLKPENLLMKRKQLHSPGDGEAYIRDMTEVVVADFGLATFSPSSVVCGSPAYVAPEVLTGGSYSVSCDVWSLGVILYVMLAGAFPFKGKTQQQTFKSILTSPLVFLPDKIWGKVSPDAMTFITLLLTKDPTTRPTAATAIKEPWITGEVEETSLEMRKLHMVGTIQELKNFKLREKVTVAMNVFKAARIFPSTTVKAKEEVEEASLPAWKRYIVPSPDDFSLNIAVRSQTDPSKVYTVALGDLRFVDTTKPGFKLQTLCNCPSTMLCRHIQYVYHWLFVGDWQSEITPHISLCAQQRQQLCDQVLERSKESDHTFPVMVGAGVSALLPVIFPSRAVAASSTAAVMLSLLCLRSASNNTQKQACNAVTLAKVDDMLLVARDFKRLYDQVPEGDKKSVLWYRKCGGGAKDLLKLKR